MPWRLHKQTPGVEAQAFLTRQNGTKGRQLRSLHNGELTRYRPVWTKNNFLRS